jgi:hypothetical protein
MRKYLLILVWIVSLANIASTDNIKQEAAVKASDAWLQLIDSGKYEESWEEASLLFKNAIKKEDWVKQIKTIREPFGKMLQRTFKSAEYMTSMPGAPDGEYYVIQYESSFENKKSAVETITPMLDKEGKWRVSGYYIR